MAAKRTVSPITRQQRKRNSEVPSKVRIRKIVPEVPRDEAERAELLEDLQVMGCSGFLEKPWGFKDVATQDRVFPHYIPNSSIKHSKSDSKDRSQEIL
jgi:hypothetical protein